jgi:hypothetical protein
MKICIVEEVVLPTPLTPVSGGTSAFDACLPWRAGRRSNPSPFGYFRNRLKARRAESASCSGFDWGAAVRLALGTSKTEILRMRRNVISLREKKLLLHKAIERVRSQLFA